MISDNPNKLRIKEQYFKRYQEMLQISNLKVLPIKPQQQQITAVNLDYLHQLQRIRSKSLKPRSLDHRTNKSNTFHDNSITLKDQTRVYTATEMTEMIKQAQQCGLLYVKNQVHASLDDDLYNKNKLHNKAIRELESTWHYNNIRRQQEFRQFNAKSIIEHLKDKLEDIIFTTAASKNKRRIHPRQAVEPFIQPTRFS